MCVRHKQAQDVVKQNSGFALLYCSDTCSPPPRRLSLPPKEHVCPLPVALDANTPPPPPLSKQRVCATPSPKKTTQSPSGRPPYSACVTPPKRSVCAPPPATLTVLLHACVHEATILVLKHLGQVPMEAAGGGATRSGGKECVLT